MASLRFIKQGITEVAGDQTSIKIRARTEQGARGELRGASRARRQQKKLADECRNAAQPRRAGRLAGQPAAGSKARRQAMGAARTRPLWQSWRRGRGSTGQGDAAAGRRPGLCTNAAWKERVATCTQTGGNGQREGGGRPLPGTWEQRGGGPTPRGGRGPAEKSRALKQRRGGLVGGSSSHGKQPGGRLPSQWRHLPRCGWGRDDGTQNTDMH